MANFVHGSRHPIVLIVTSDGVAASPTDIVKRILGPEVCVMDLDLKEGFRMTAL